WDGISWSGLGSGVGISAGGGVVRALAVAGGDLFAGGFFTRAGGNAANNVAKWDGTSWSSLGAGMNDEVEALAVSGSNVYAGGKFTKAGGNTAYSITKWDGNSWS